ncbi:aminoglycoside phosphotransferase family protein [Solirubrobacter phytolaccae]|uniref:Aminoglycoside phosphotransferase family protein n=1 Tax=Solirubrobacter phytolaccae TaxID=1404360 RepID=A0A9X3N600_9ACTN|nr:aminoglycoside phosphotransferase family protein [Solirubrobacter phytolaccae]MDA0180121.1 aminoglycoside phosphotransferase family protein [Solirubrobacter phytolaccae]
MTDNADAIARRFTDGAEFLATVESRATESARRWALKLLEPLPMGIGGYLVGVRTKDGRDAVLKLSPTAPPQARANRLEVYALRRWAGAGAVNLLAHDADAGALLLERCTPGVTIDSLPDEEMIVAGCALARRLQRVADAKDRTTLPGTGDVVCHGDLNPGNLLSHRDGWVAIDPLPVLAEPAYDAVSLVWSKRDWLLSQPDPRRVLDRRLQLAAAALAVDADRIRLQTLRRIEALLTERASWGGYDEAPFVALAALLDQPE